MSLSPRNIDASISAATVADCRSLASAWAPVLRALAHEERLLIALWLAEGECSVRELEKATGLAQSLVSYHLRELREAGLVVAAVHGRSNRYRLAHGHLDQLATLLGNLEPGSAASA